MYENEDLGRIGQQLSDISHELEPIRDMRDEVEIMRQPLWAIAQRSGGLALPLWVIAGSMVYIAYQLT